MAITKLQIYNDALRSLGDLRLATITDDVEARYALDDAWANGLQFVFTEGYWNFATKSATLTYNNALTAIPGYSYGYDKPSDWLRTILISPTALFDVEANYRDEGGKWYSNYTTMYIRYTSNTLAADGSVSSWPIAFARMVSAYLAMECCDRVTGNNTKKQELVQLYNEALATARNKDALDQAKLFPRPGSWLRGMRSNSGAWDRGPLSGY